MRKSETYRNEIKSYIVRTGRTMTEVVDYLSDEYGWSRSVPNLSGKLKRGSLRYGEAVELADALGYAGGFMRTGLTKKQKTTVIYFDEHSRIIEVQTHNTDLKKRLTAFAAKHPQCCRQTDDDEQGGLTFEIEKGRLSFRLTAPYSEERRQFAKKNEQTISF